MPCKRDQKTEDISHKVKRKTEQEKKRKKIRTKTERTGKKTKKERRELVQRACTNRSASLSPPSKISPFSKKNANENFPSGTITIQADSLKAIKSHDRILPRGLFALRRGVLPSLVLLRQTKLIT